MRTSTCLLLLATACSGNDAWIRRPYESPAGADAPPAHPTGGGSGNGTKPRSVDGGSDGGDDGGPWPGSDVILLPFGQQKTANVAQCGAVLTDLAQHLPSMYGTQYDLPTDCIAWGEALTIGIDSHVTSYLNPYAAKGVAAGGFYVTKGQMAFVVEPAATKLSDVAPHVPASLHGPTFQRNLVDAVADFDSMPTELLDEWVLQTNGADVAVELGAAGMIASPRDGVSGALELTIYALAFGATVEAIEPAAWKTSKQLVEFLAWHAQRAMTLYRTGAAMAPYTAASQAALYAAWKTSADAKPLRNFARRTFGGAYVTKVLEIGGATE